MELILWFVIAVLTLISCYWIKRAYHFEEYYKINYHNYKSCLLALKDKKLDSYLEKRDKK